MKAIRLHGKAATEADIKGRVLVHDLGPELRKGSILRAADLPRIQQAGEIHVIELEPGDVHEDEAARRLAAMVAGPGVIVHGPVESQVPIWQSIRASRSCGSAFTRGSASVSIASPFKACASP